MFSPSRSTSNTHATGLFVQDGHSGRIGNSQSQQLNSISINKRMVAWSTVNMHDNIQHNVLVWNGHQVANIAKKVAEMDYYFKSKHVYVYAHTYACMQS